MLRIERNAYHGKRCFIIASGPSIKEENLLPLKDEITICVNESYKALPFDPTFIFIGDYKLWPFVKDKYASMKNTKIIAGSGLDGSCGSDYKGSNLYGLLHLQKERSIITHGFHWDLANNNLYKGFGIIPEVVLPFVCYTGFYECYFLGLDCKTNGYSFSNPSRGVTEQRIDSRVFDTYETIANTPNLPTKIVNLSKGSELKSFPFNSLEEVMKSTSRITDYQVVGYYTPNNNYPFLARRMKESVEKQGMNVQIFERPNLISAKCHTPPMPWVMNCAQKAQFCLQMFEQFPDKHILYLDADAVMERFPDLLVSLDLPEFDIAAPFLTNPWVKNELVSNTLIFRRTKTCQKILEEWVKETDKRVTRMIGGSYPPPFHEAWDQKILQDILNDIPHITFPLPWEYAKITPTSKGVELMKGVDYSKIVISQYQASRQNKFKVGT